jgi:uncharacterized membrane protein
MPSKHRAPASAKLLKTYRYPIIGLVLLLIIILLASYGRHSAVLTDATTHKAQPYTELYFTHPDQLPVAVTDGQAVPISFTVHNLEGHAVTYNYAITFTNAQGQTTTVRRQRVTVANGQTTIVQPRAVALPTYRGRAAIGIVLLNYPEQLHFWVVDQPATTGVSG